MPAVDDLIYTEKLRYETRGKIQKYDQNTEMRYKPKPYDTKQKKYMMQNTKLRYKTKPNNYDTKPNNYDTKQKLRYKT